MADLSSHRGPNVVLKGHNWNIRGCAFSPDGTRIITGSEDRTARVWDSATGEEIYKLGSVNNVEPAKGHVHQVWAVGFLPQDADTVYTGGFDGDVRLWKLGEETPACIRTISLTGPATSICALPDDGGTQLLCSSGQLIFKLDLS